MKERLFSFALILSFTAGLSACTTTTRTLTTDISVAPVSQAEKAKRAFSQNNYSLAASLLEPMATDGDDNAQYALGYLNYNGMGVPRNKALAIRWFKESASKGNKNAIEAMRMILPADSINGDSARDDSPHSMDMTDLPTLTPSTDSDVPAKKDQIESRPADELAQSVVDQQPVEMTGPSVSDGQTDASVSPEQASVTGVTEELESNEVPAEKASEVAGSVNSLTESEKWLVSQPDTNFTIQLIVSGSERAMRHYISVNKLQDSAIYYRSPNKGGDLYILVTGSYESFGLASKAISRLSKKLKRAKPWIRSMSEIKGMLLSR